MSLSDRPSDPAAGPTFAHASEAELARILDFYAVRWEYEPHVFPILWDLDGHVLESFAPDFFLPDLGLYIELTTLRQSLVRKKNRKLRRLRELYPDLRVKLLYARDFRALMLKYGKIAIAAELSGTLGQVVPDRSPGDPATSAAAAAAAMDSLVGADPVVSAYPTGAPIAAARRQGDRGPRRRADRAAIDHSAGSAAGIAGSTDGTLGEERATR